MASHLGRALSPGKEHLVLIVQEAGWASELVWTQRLEEKFFVPGIVSRLPGLSSSSSDNYYTQLHLFFKCLLYQIHSTAVIIIRLSKQIENVCGCDNSWADTF
jgi:hypothetical protein